MKDWVKEKLAIIDSLYPPERIQKSKDRWKKMWEKKRPGDRYPFNTVLPLFNPYNANHPPEQRLRAYLDACIFMDQIHDDFIPSIFPGCKPSTIPNMFGAPEFIKGDNFFSERILKSPEDIDRLPEPSMASGTVAHEWLTMEQYLLEETEGRIPIHVCDMQGPVDVCGQLWGYDNLFLCAYDDPERFHSLMEKVSMAFLMLWKKQEEILGDAFVGTHLFAWDWVPTGNGASLSADSLVMVSPDYYDEFYKPYMVKLGKELGGLSVHSCGNFSGVVKNLCNTPHIKAINASQMTVAQLLDAALDREKVVIAMIDLDELESNMRLIKENNMGCCITVAGLWPTEEGKMDNPTAWTLKDWDTIHRKKERILEIMAV